MADRIEVAVVPNGGVPQPPPRMDVDRSLGAELEAEKAAADKLKRDRDANTKLNAIRKFFRDLLNGVQDVPGGGFIAGESLKQVVGGLQSKILRIESIFGPSINSGGDVVDPVKRAQEEEMRRIADLFQASGVRAAERVAAMWLRDP